MVLYARADVDYVCVPAESGGCGKSHSRPVISGAPAKEFKLDCQQCENFLRADIARTGNKKIRTVNADHGLKLAERYMGLWGATPETIPETPDAEKQREWTADRTALENASTQTEAFGKIAEALQGNQELILKLAEMVSLSAKQGGPLSQILPVPAVTSAAALPAPRDDPAADAHSCLDCGTEIVRKEGQRGALAQRCPDCKEKHVAAKRQSYRAGRAA